MCVKYFHPCGSMSHESEAEILRTRCLRSLVRDDEAPSGANGIGWRGRDKGKRCGEEQVGPGARPTRPTYFLLFYSAGC